VAAKRGGGAAIYCREAYRGDVMARYEQLETCCDISIIERRVKKNGVINGGRVLGEMA